MVKSKKKDTIHNNITDWYNIVPQHLKTNYDNPAYDNHLIKIPARILIIGASGSGKTTLVLELISRMKNTFSHIILCVRDVNEPLYKYFLSKVDRDQVEVHENGEVPNLEKFKDTKDQILCIFDDLVLSDQKKIQDYFMKGRKVAGGITMVYLSQSYYKVPKFIRLQANYLMLKKLASSRDLGMILKENSLNVDKKELFDMYEYATSEKSGFLMIDLEGDESQRFRRNFLEVL